MSRMTSDIENLQQLLQDGLAQFAIQGLTMVVITVFLFATNVKLAAITVLRVLLPLIVMSIWFKRASERGYDKVRDGIALVLADLSESLQGVRIVTAHNRQRYNIETHRDVVGSYRDANNYTGRINSIYGPGSQALSVFGQVLILGFGGYMFLHHAGDQPRRSSTAFFLYVNRFFAPDPTADAAVQLVPAGPGLGVQAAGLLETEPSVLEAPDAVELPPDPGRDPLRPRVVRLRPGPPGAARRRPHASRRGDGGVRRRHRGRQVHDGQAGHAFYDPTEGRVLIDGYDLTPGDARSRCVRQLGVVPQEPFLFAGTIRDNISFARPGAPDDEVWNAVHQVGLEELVAPAALRARHAPSTNGASRSLQGSASSSPWAAPLWPSRGCSCSTRRPRTSTSSPRRWSSGARCAAGGPHRGAHRAPALDRDAGGPHRRRGRRPAARGRLPRRACRARRALRRDVRDLDQPVARGRSCARSDRA